jgi:hypothetical protein
MGYVTRTPAPFNSSAMSIVLIEFEVVTLAEKSGELLLFGLLLLLQLVLGFKGMPFARPFPISNPEAPPLRKLVWCKSWL